MSILLIGCGYWGRNWAKTLNAIGELGAICEPSPVLQEQIKSNYPDVAVYAKLDDALKHSGIEGCVIATPVPTHSIVAQQCLLADKHVLVEKPLTLYSIEAEELVELAESRNLVLAVGHVLMYHPALLALQNLIRSGELGEILAVQCTRVNLGKIRNEENVWWSLAPHDISIVSLLLEEPLIPVSASRQNLLRRPEIADTVSASFTTPSGREASVRVSWLSPVKQHETIVIGSEKIAIFDDALPADRKLSVLDYHLDRNGDHVSEIQRGNSQAISFETGGDDILTREARGFIAAIRDGASIPNTGRNGLLIVQMLEQVQSMLENQTKNVAALAR